MKSVGRIWTFPLLRTQKLSPEKRELLYSDGTQNSPQWPPRLHVTWLDLSFQSHITYPLLTELQSHGPSFRSSNPQIYSVQPFHFPKTLKLISSRSRLLDCRGSIQGPRHQRDLRRPLGLESVPWPYHNYIILCVLLHSPHHLLIIHFAFICFWLTIFLTP